MCVRTWQAFSIKPYLHQSNGTSDDANNSGTRVYNVTDDVAHQALSVGPILVAPKLAY